MPTKKAVNSQPRASFLVPYVVSDESDSELDWTASWREPDSRDLSDHEQVIPEPEMQSERQSADSSNPISSDDNDQETDDESQINDEDNPAKGYLQSGNYMPFQKSLELLLRSESSYDHIPSGKKENVYFVLNNETNLANRDSNRKSDFSDDCGVWNSLVGTTPTTYYKIDAHGNFKTIYKNSKLGFCNLSRVKGKNGRTERKYVPLNPQPAENEIMVLHRYYATSNADPNYKKRVTWLGKGGVQSNLAIVEYRGKFPGLKPHGNSKDSESEYLRTPVHVMTEVAELLKSNKPKMVFEHMKKKYDEVTRPTSIQQIRDKKKYDKAKNQDTLTGYSKNAADHIQQLENMVTHNHSYVRAIVRTNAKTPVVILYNDEQLSDIKNICCSGQAVLGVDKTFNLCDVHVTVTCYKQTSVVRHNSDDENAFPIFLGPIFFHDNSDFETYCAFFHHLKMKLIDANLTKLVIGTDDEAAMVKAITTAFPESTHVLCTRHLKQNTNQKLLDDAVDKAERNQILNKIYGQDGILHADDTICFEEKCSELEEQCAQISTKFHRYFTGRLKTLLKLKVNDPVRQDMVPSRWTNNNCESLNHVLKQAIDWRSKPLVDLVSIMQDIADGQFKDLRSAMIRTGEFRLADSHRHFELTKTDWVNKTDVQREKAFRRFRKFVFIPKNVMISTDGQTEIIAPRTFGKKINQQKRKINARTRTNKKRKIQNPAQTSP